MITIDEAAAIIREHLTGWGESETDNGRRWERPGTLHAVAVGNYDGISTIAATNGYGVSTAIMNTPLGVYAVAGATRMGRMGDDAYRAVSAVYEACANARSIQ